MKNLNFEEMENVNGGGAPSLDQLEGLDPELAMKEYGCGWVYAGMVFATLGVAASFGAGAGVMIIALGGFASGYPSYLKCLGLI